MPGLGSASYASLMGLLICAIPMVVGLLYLLRPGERLLSLMRPLTMAAIFSAACSIALAMTNGLVALSRTSALDASGVGHVAIVVAEGMIPVIGSFACLTAGWVCVAVGMRKGD
jgi:hypothetical protein